MGIHHGLVFWLVCDSDVHTDWDDEEDGVFDSQEQAISYGISHGWLILADRIVCPDCANKLDCALTGHQWGDWVLCVLYGVLFHERGCTHCGTDESNPPKPALDALLQLAREVDGSEGGAAA